MLREAGFAIDTSFRSCGADDFSFYSPVAPILMLFVGSGGPFTLHHPKFLPPDEAVGQVASAMLAGYLAALTLLLCALSRPAAGRGHLQVGIAVHGTRIGLVPNPKTEPVRSGLGW